jgi:hypothetical protein
MKKVKSIVAKKAIRPTKSLETESVDNQRQAYDFERDTIKIHN